MTPYRAWIVQYPEYKGKIKIEKSKYRHLYNVIEIKNNEIIGLVKIIKRK